MKELMILTLALVIMSCDTRLDPIEKINQAPGLTISNKDNSWSTDDNYKTALSDSVKLNRNYLISFSLVEQQDITNFYISDMDGEAYYKDSNVTDITGLEKGQGVIKLEMLSLGSQEIKLNCIDIYGEESFATLSLTVFDNLPPVVPQIQVSDLPSTFDYDIEIDVSSAYDRDQKYGGGVKMFEVVIESDTNLYPHNIIPYVLPGSGTYNISVRAIDFDGAFSQSISTTYTI